MASGASNAAQMKYASPAEPLLNPLLAPQEGQTGAIANPAEQLSGLRLEGGWTVGEMLRRPPESTGGCFSVSYHVVSDGGAKAFLKALDFSEALHAPDPARVLQSLTDAYNFERDLLAQCANGRMDRVVRAIADGTIRGSGLPVQYLILELADGDVRRHLAAVGRIDVAWKLRALHHIATGLWQLHKVGIAHQDMKPSNALVCNTKETKVGDLGRAAYKGHKAPSDNCPCAGDPAYAPPELLYNHLPSDWGQRRFGCDLYLLGSMVVFLFAGVSMTSLLLTEMHADYGWRTWTGTFPDVLPYVRDAFNRALQRFHDSLDERLRSELTQIVRQLCEPDPELRGHHSDRQVKVGMLSLERFVSAFNRLARRAELGL